MVILNSKRILTLTSWFCATIAAVSLTACGGNSTGARSTQASTFQGYWKGTEGCFVENNNKQCFPIEEDNYIMISGDGGIYAIEDGDAAPCRLTGNKATCEGTTLTFSMQGSDKMTVSGNSEGNDFELHLKRVSSDEYLAKKKQYEGKVQPLNSAIASLNGKTLVLEKKTELSYNKKTGAKSEYTTWARDIADEEQYASDDGSKFGVINPKVLQFTGRGRVTVNRKHQTDYSLDLDESNGGRAILYMGLSLKDGVLEEGSYSNFANRLDVTGSTVQAISVSEFTPEPGDNSEPYIYTTILYYKIATE